MNRFYLGVVPLMGSEYPGQHAALLTPELWHAAATRKEKRTLTTRRVAHRALAGRVFSRHCERPLWADLLRNGHAAYRERHGRPCRTGGRSIVAARLDEQMGEVFAAIRLDEDALQAALDEARRMLTPPEDLRRLRRQSGDWRGPTWCRT